MVAIQNAKEEKEEALLTLKSIKKNYLSLEYLGYNQRMIQKTLGRKTTGWVMKLACSEVLGKETEDQSE